jgi:Ca2+-binding EF-hand superfamily protein
MCSHNWKKILILFVRVEEMFKQLDRDGDGTLDYNEFAQMLGI